MTENQFIYTLTEPGPRAFTMPAGFQGDVEIHLWGAGGGTASSTTTATTYYNWYNAFGGFIGQYTYASTVAYGGTYSSSIGGIIYGYSQVATSTTNTSPSNKGGGGGYAKAVVNISAGDIVEIGLGLVGADATKDEPGMGGSSSVGARYSGGPGGKTTTAAGGGGAGATIVLVNGNPVAVAAGGSGGGISTSGRGGGDYTTLSTNTQGLAATSAIGGGGGGYLGGGIGQGGQNFGDVTEVGFGTTAGGRNTLYAPKATYGNAGYNGYAVLVFTRRFQMNEKAGGEWKPIEKAYFKAEDDYVPYTPILPPATQSFTSTGVTTFTVPERVFSITVIANGGAGGAGGGDAGKNYNGNGAGGGGANKKTQTFSVTPGQQLTITVGAGGAGGPVGGDGIDGKPSTVTGNGVSFTTSAGTHGGGYYTGREVGVGADGANNGNNAIFGGAGGTSTNGGANGGTGGTFKRPGGKGGNGSVLIDYIQSAQTVLVNAGGWKEIDQVYIKSSGVWRALKSIATINDARSRKYVTPGTYTWTAPEDVSKVKVLVYGAGGSGTGGAGGSGGFADKYITVTPGNQYVVVVGAGGVGSGSGQSSSFDASVIANGGGAGIVAGGGSSAGGAGGTATGGDTNITGESGSAGKPLVSYWYWWHGWGGYRGWGGYNYYTYGYGAYNYYWGFGQYVTGYYGWGWPSYYRQTGYDFGIPGTGYDRIGSGAVGPAANAPKGASGAVFVLY